MSPTVRRLSLFAAAGAAGLLCLGVALAETKPADAGAQTQTERRIVIIRHGPDGREVRIERSGPDGDSLDSDAEVDLDDAFDVAAMPPMPTMPPMGPMAAREFHLVMDPARHADRLREILQLRKDQEPALQAFLKDAEPQAPAAPAADGAAPEEQTTPQRIEQMRARLAARQAAFERRAAATNRFYAQLSDSQKKVFDRLHAAPMHMAFMMMGGHGGPRWGWRSREAPPAPPAPPAPQAAPAPPAPPAG